MGRSQRGTMIAEAGQPTADLLVTSVHVMIFTRDGQRIFEGRGGIDFVHVIDLSRFARKRKPETKIRDNLPGSLDALREGIELAFAPYLRDRRSSGRVSLWGALPPAGAVSIEWVEPPESSPSRAGAPSGIE